MYLSPAVRTMREDPTPDAEARLAIRTTASDPSDAIADTVREHGGVVDRKTRFGTLHATVPEPAVAGLLDALPEGVEAVETVTPGLSGDAGEDVDPGQRVEPDPDEDVDHGE